MTDILNFFIENCNVIDYLRSPISQKNENRRWILFADIDIKYNAASEKAVISKHLVS